MTIRAAKVNSDNIVENVIVLNNMSEAPPNYVECGEWIGVGSNINAPEPIYPKVDPVEKLKKFLQENPDVIELLS
jgi:hypothetical protein